MAKKALGTYFWYAIGEIFLVVAGILIALQINNWNEERIEQKQVREYALALASDLQRDLDMLAPVEKQINHQIRLSNELADYMDGRSLDDIQNIDLYVFTRNPFYRPYEWNRAVLEQMKSSGALRQFENQELAKKISEYDALTRHLDNDLSNDQSDIRQAVDAVLGVINMNYSRRADIKVYDDDSDEDFLTAFFESDLYRELKDSHVKLLSDDINQVQRATNYFIEISLYLGARTDIEIPRLRANGLEIINLINAEYGE